MIKNKSLQLKERDGTPISETSAYYKQFTTLIRPLYETRGPDLTLGEVTDAMRTNGFFDVSTCVGQLRKGGGHWMAHKNCIGFCKVAGSAKP